MDRRRAQRRRTLGAGAALALVAGLLGVSDTRVAASGLAPVTEPDYELDVNADPVVFDVLANDTDPEGDTIALLSTSGSSVQGGTFDCAGTTCTYTPPASLPQAEFDHFDYLVTDGSSLARGTAAAIFIPHLPEAGADEVFVREAGPVAVDVLANDSSPLGLPLSVVPDSQALDSGGVVECTTTSCTYTPPDPPDISDSFTYTVTDGTRTGEGQVALYDGRPQVADDEVEYLGSPIAIEVLANDYSPEGLPLSVVAQAATPTDAGGVVACDSSACTYTPPDPMPEVDVFHYRATDGSLEREAEVRILNLVCVDPTEALNDNALIAGYEWEECTGYSSNGSGADVSPLLPSTGDTSLVMTNGTVAAAEAPNDEPDTTGSPARHNIYNGAEDVQVLRLDLDVPAGASCVAFDYVFGSEESPEFVDSKFEDAFVAELDATTWSAKGAKVSAPDAFNLDANGDPVTVGSTFFQPGAVVTATGSEYDGSTPKLTAVSPVTPGAHSLWLSVFDAGDAVYDSGVVVDNLRVGTDAAAGCLGGLADDVAVDDAVVTDEDEVVTFDVLANDDLLPGASPTVTVVADGIRGTATCESDGNCRYEPDPDASGTDLFTYRLDDGLGTVDGATVTVEVRPVNDDPVAEDDTLAARIGVSDSVDVLANDSDVDGDDLTVVSNSDGAHGSVSCDPDGVCTYTPTGRRLGGDSFTYVIEDGAGGSDSATVTVDVAPADRPPVAEDDALVLDEDAEGIVEVLANDTDPDGDDLRVVDATQGANGTVDCDLLGVCTYEPVLDWFGEDSFTYTIDDGRGGTDVGTVAVTVEPVDDPPMPRIDLVTTDQGVPVTVDVLANDEDVDGDPLTVDSHGPARNGSVICDPAGACTYTPDPGFTGPDGFTYVVDDGVGGQSASAVIVLVGSAPEPCTTDDLEITVRGGVQGQFAGCVDAGDVVVESDIWSVSSVKGSLEVPSLGGGRGTATVTFDLERVGLINAYTGTVTVDDPAEGGELVAVAFLAPLGSHDNVATGNLLGRLGEGLDSTGFSISFRVEDLG